MTALSVLEDDIVQKQNCSVCPHIDKCWKTTTNNIIINLLVCRIQIGLERDASTKLLLKMFRPQLQKTARQLRDSNTTNQVTLSYPDLIHEMESVIVEHIISDYIIGEIAYFTPYIFGYPNGVMRKWTVWKLNQQKRFFGTHYLTDDPRPILDEEAYEPFEEDSDNKINIALQHIDDGVTLRASEYRVMKFCLKNAHDNRPTRMVDGLHLYMAKKMEISRTRVTVHFRKAKNRILRVCQV